MKNNKNNAVTPAQRRKYINKYCVVEKTASAFTFDHSWWLKVYSKETHKYITAGRSLDRILTDDDNFTLDLLIKQDITFVDSTFEDSDVANIGFSPKNISWYGWSHRGWCDFTIGSQVKKGDCAYNADNREDYEKSCIDFWCGSKEDGMLNPHIINRTDKEFTIEATYSTDPEIIPNAKLRGTIWHYTEHYPSNMGKGEWVAKTMEDAKQMACDYAESVA